ncbi:MAG: MFS transporter [Pseudomonadales bacterium]|jgi:MFS family permease
MTASTPESPGPHATDERALEESLVWINRNGIGIQIMETLAVGAFLTAYAIKLDASNFLIGLLAALPHLSQLAQIPAIHTVDRTPSRRKVYTISGMVARPMFLVIALTVLIPDPGIALTIVAVAFFLRYVAGAFIGCAWNAWMRELIPDDLMGRVFGERQKKMIGIGILVSLSAAGFIDLWEGFVPLPETYAFGIVYALAFGGGMYAVMTARHIHDVVMPPHPEPVPLMSRLGEPFRQQNFRRLLAFLASWNFAINLAAPFFTVFMLRGMEMSLFVVIGLATLSQFAAYFTVTHWGEIADRFSNKAVLRFCAPLFIASIFAWTFTTMPDVHPLTYPLLIAIHVATGLANAGVSLASGNITLKLAPRGNATAYLATSAMVCAAAASAATMVGGATADFFASMQLSLILRWQSGDAATEFNAMDFTYWDFFFIFATVIGLYALHRLSLVREDGEPQENVVFNRLMRDAWRSLRNLSSIAGLRSSTDFPMAVFIDEPTSGNGSEPTEGGDDDPTGGGPRRT